MSSAFNWFDCRPRSIPAPLSRRPRSACGGWWQRPRQRRPVRVRVPEPVQAGGWRICSDRGRASQRQPSTPMPASRRQRPARHAHGARRGARSEHRLGAGRAQGTAASGDRRPPRQPRRVAPSRRQRQALTLYWPRWPAGKLQRTSMTQRRRTTCCRHSRCGVHLLWLARVGL